MLLSNKVKILVEFSCKRYNEKKQKKEGKMAMKRERGITLIALVIIIIVLLILATVSIITLTGENGILTKADKARTETDEKGALEAVQLEIAGSFDDGGIYQVAKAKENLKNNLKIPEENINQNRNTLKVKYGGFSFKVEADGTVRLCVPVDYSELGVRGLRF